MYIPKSTFGWRAMNDSTVSPGRGTIGTRVGIVKGTLAISVLAGPGDEISRCVPLAVRVGTCATCDFRATGALAAARPTGRGLTRVEDRVAGFDGGDGGLATAFPLLLWRPAVSVSNLPSTDKLLRMLGGWCLYLLNL